MLVILLGSSTSCFMMVESRSSGCVSESLVELTFQEVIYFYVIESQIKVRNSGTIIVWIIYTVIILSGVVTSSRSFVLATMLQKHHRIGFIQLRASTHFWGCSGRHWAAG